MRCVTLIIGTDAHIAMRTPQKLHTYILMVSCCSFFQKCALQPER